MGMLMVLPSETPSSKVASKFAAAKIEFAFKALHFRQLVGDSLEPLSARRWLGFRSI